MNARNITVVSERERPTVDIGCRWKPGLIERVNTETGHFEMVNSTMEKRSEMEVQLALLAPVRSRYVERRIEAARTARKGD